MSAEVEPTLLEYARYYGIALDHRKKNPLHDPSTPDNISAQLEDPPDVPRIDQSSGRLPLERLSVTAEAAVLLSSIKESEQGRSRFDEDIEIEVHRFQRIKQELPILQTDHDLDLQSFAPQIVPDLENEHLPLEEFDDEADEGLEWPSSYYGLPDRFFNAAKRERLDPSKNGMLYLHAVLRSVPIDGDEMKFEPDEVLLKKKPIVEPLSPPLLPLSPEIVPFEPSSDTGRLDYLSDHTSPTRQEIRAIDNIVLKEDAIVLDKQNQESGSGQIDPVLLGSDNLGYVYSPLKGIGDPPSSPPISRAKSKDWKVEVPLTPPTSDQQPPWNTYHASFSETLRDLIPNLPSSITKPEEVLSEDTDAFFRERIAPIAIKAERSIQQEQLQEADTTLRVAVPVMDFSLPQRPWSNHNVGADDYKKILSEMKEVHLSKHFWLMEGKAERGLKWTPFPAALGRITTQEEIPDDGTIALFVDQPDRVDISTLTWKPEGLRILDDLNESDEENLEYATFPEASDLGSLIRKRRFELQENEVYDVEPKDQLFNSIPSWSRPEPKAGQKLPRLNPPASKQRDPAEPTKNHQNPVTEPFSAISALDSFMTIRTGELKQLDLVSTPYFLPQPLRAELSTTHQPPQPLQATPAVIPTPPARPHLTSPVPTPLFLPPSTPHPFIISSTLLQSRRLIRQIQSLYPTAEFISRDFSLHTTAPFPPRHSNNKATLPQLPGPEAEADLLLSPSTGLILASIPHLTQVPLPGQKTPAQNPLRARVQAAALRYAHLIVVITTSSSLSPTDTETLTTFVAFCAALSTPLSTATPTSSPATIQPIIIPTTANDSPSHTDITTARWTAALMCKHGGDPIPLLQDETLWEIWLRRAGMNAFAAQAVLGALKKPPPSSSSFGRQGEHRALPGAVEIPRDSGGGHSGTGDQRGFDYGLPALVKMPPPERLRRFGAMMGGSGVLERVGRVLDGAW